MGGQVSTKNVSGVVGSLWSVEIVCHRAVTVMYREMITCLTKILRGSRATASKRVQHAVTTKACMEGFGDVVKIGRPRVKVLGIRGVGDTVGTDGL